MRSILILLALVAPLAHAEHPTREGDCDTPHGAITLGTGHEPTLYYYDGFLYAESNGHPGLQMGPCDHGPSDTIVF